MNNKLTLLQKAKLSPGGKPKNKYGEQELELIKAWLNENINATQVARAIGRDKNDSSVNLFIIKGVREIWRTKKVN